MTTKRTPVRPKKPAKKTTKTGKLRPSITSDQRVRHGINSLDKLLKQDLDKRLSVARKRDQLEAELIDQAGSPDRLTPTLILLIRRIVHKALICDQSEKMALLNEYNLSDKRYIALSNSLRLDIALFESMLKNRPTMKAPSLAEILEAESHES